MFCCPDQGRPFLSREGMSLLFFPGVPLNVIAMSFGERRKTNRDNNGSRGGLKICSFFWKPRKTWRHFFFSLVPLLSGHSFCSFFSFSWLLSSLSSVSCSFRPSLLLSLSSALPWNFTFNPHTHLCTKLLTNHPWKILTILLAKEEEGGQKEEVCRTVKKREEKRSLKIERKSQRFFSVWLTNKTTATK